MRNGCVDVFLGVEQFDVLGNAARHAEQLHELALRRLFRKELAIAGKRQLPHMQLRRASAIERASMGQRLLHHERDERAAQDQHHVAFAQQRIPYALQHGKKRVVGLPQVLEFVKHDDDALRDVLRQAVKQVVPAIEGRVPDQVVVKEIGYHALEGGAVLGFRFLGCQEIDATLVLQEVHQQRRFADSATAIHHHERRLVALVLALKRHALVFTGDQHAQASRFAVGRRKTLLYFKV